MTISNPRKHALIFGATGGFGSAITKVMANNGWQVSALTRKPKASAANIPYPKWNPVMINYTRNIIDIAQKANAHLIFIGNVYNLGIPEDGVISHDTPDAPINEKGEVRSTLEQMIKDASATGLKATIMRFGDFFGPGVTQNNWFIECTKKLHKNKLTAMGPVDMPHTWTYLPDAASATEQVAAARLQTTELPNYLVLPFQGHVFSFRQLAQQIETIKGEKIELGKIPWPLFKLLGVVWPLMKDIVSMRYLWQHDIQLDGSALAELTGQPEHTDLADALQQTIPDLCQSSLESVPA